MGLAPHHAFDMFISSPAPASRQPADPDSKPATTARRMIHAPWHGRIICLPCRPMSSLCISHLLIHNKGVKSHLLAHSVYFVSPGPSLVILCGVNSLQCMSTFAICFSCLFLSFLSSWPRSCTPCSVAFRVHLRPLLLPRPFLEQFSLPQCFDALAICS